VPPHATGKFFHHVEISETAMTKQLAIEDCVIRFSLNRVDSYPKMKKAEARTITENLPEIWQGLPANT
jgi:hypothetical protein